MPVPFSQAPRYLYPSLDNKPFQKQVKLRSIIIKVAAIEVRSITRAQEDRVELL